MKHFFFLDQSDFLTNFLDLAQSELKKQSKQASIVKLQSLLDLAVRNPASSSSNDPYKDNLKVTMASQGLYEWLLKIVSRTGGGLGDDGGGGGGTGDLDFASSGGVDEDPSVQKTLFGKLPLLSVLEYSWERRWRALSLIPSSSTRRSGIRLFSQIPLIPRHLTQNHHTLPANIPIPPPSPSSRIRSFDNVARPQSSQLARRLREPRYATLEITYILITF